MKKEKDPKFLEQSKMLAETWKRNVEEVAKEKDLDIKKDFRTILTIIKKRNT